MLWSEGEIIIICYQKIKITWRNWKKSFWQSAPPAMLSTFYQLLDFTSVPHPRAFPPKTLISPHRHRSSRLRKGKGNKSRVEIKSLGSVYSTSASPDRQGCTALDNCTKYIPATPLKAKHKF